MIKNMTPQHLLESVWRIRIRGIRIFSYIRIQLKPLKTEMIIYIQVISTGSIHTQNMGFERYSSLFKDFTDT